LRFFHLALVALTLLALVSPAWGAEHGRNKKGKGKEVAEAEKAKASAPAAPEVHVANIRVIILPFDVESTDLSPLRRNVMDGLATDLHSAGAEIAGIDVIKDLVLKEKVARFDEAEAYKVAEKVPADFAVIGAISKAGVIARADWRILDLKNKTVVALYEKSSASEGELQRLVGAEAGAMYEKMSAVLSARPSVKTGKIDRVAVFGNRRVDTDAILKKVASRAGEEFSPDTVKDDIRNIYALGYFDAVMADLTDTASGKVLTFVVKEMPFIKKVEWKGNSEIKDDKIKDALTIKENTVLDRALLGENTEKLKALYTDEGFYLATIKPVVESDGLEARVRFEINEGPEVMVRRITFIGNKFFSAKKLKGFMNTSEKGLLSIITKSGKFNEFIFQNDLNIIIAKYMDNGFINADITDHRVLLSEDKKWFFITIAVSEGDQYRIGKIDVQGDILPSTSKEDLLDRIKMGPGDVYDRSKLAKGIEAITDVYGDQGYAYADIKPNLQPDNNKKTVDITLNIKKNELVYVERIDISGNVRTRDKVIRREFELEEGDLFNSSALKRTKNDLKRLGYFEDVKISEQPGAGPDKIKLNVDVKERPTGQVSFGFGYSSVDKLIGTASISQSNFMGTGIALNLSGTISHTSSNYVLGFTEPWLFDKPISAGFDIYDTDRIYTDFDIRRKGFDLRAGFPIWGRYTRGFLTYKLENINISNVLPTASSFIQAQQGKSTESSITASIRRDTRDDAFFPTEGSVENLSIQFAGGPLGGTNYFIKYEGDAIKYFRLPFDMTFSIRGSAGYIDSYAGKTTPIGERYFLGGLDTIRGFPIRTISPRDPATGDLVGGNSMMFTQTEVIFPIMPEQNLRGVVFFDAGNAYINRINFSDIREGAGFGVRWFSPIGPLRLELGFNLNPRVDEKRQVWDFAIGGLF